MLKKEKLDGYMKGHLLVPPPPLHCLHEREIDTGVFKEQLHGKPSQTCHFVSQIAPV